MFSHAVVLRFKPDAPLVRSGLVSVDHDGDLPLSRRLNRLATVPGNDLDVKDLLLGRPEAAELERSDFDHVAADRDHVERLLKGALRSGEPGVNILLHGPPGTGKTQFCRTVAETRGVPLFSAGEDDEEGGEPTRTERVADLRLSQYLLSREGKSLIFFDEMADLFPDRGWTYSMDRRGLTATSGASKLFMNRLLETAPVPTLWTANTGEQIPAVLLRRMKFALELRLPPPRIRARIWSRQLARNGIEAGPEEALALATCFEAPPPGVAAEVIAAARLTGGGIASVRQACAGLPGRCHARSP